MLLDAANRFDSAEARRRAGEVLNSEGRQQPIVVAFAAEVVLGAVPHLPQADALSLSRSLIRRLEPAREAIEKADTGEFDLSTLTKICRLLGFCHECLGEHQAAVSDYSRGIAADPSNDVLLVHRGILLYGESARSLGDFELAIECGSPVIWPYYFLAHNALIGGLFEECRSLSERALEMEGSRTAKSELCEWLAISRSALGYPAEAVRQAFDRSIRLDPGNEQARRNLSTFESANPPIQPGKFELRDKTAIRLSSLYERRIRPAA
jgi:tetratricopeptide (TPR) repeat protein